jgi:cell division protein FtsW
VTKKSPLIISVLLLTLIGIFFIAISSLSEASSTIGDQFFFLKKQLTWIPISLIAFFIASKINLKLIIKFITPAYLFSILLLVLVFVPQLGSTALGASRWINLGIISFQPSELYKLISIIFFSYMFSQEKYRHTKNLTIYLLPALILVILEPNLSTAILITTIIFTLFYISGGNILAIFSISAFAVLMGIVLIFTSPYRQARLQTLLDPQDEQSISYHSQQITIAIASGGLTGKGFANSDQKYKFLPKLSTDSILAVIGEETGFIGITIIIYLYLVLIFYLLKIGRLIQDQFQSLIIVGIACWIAFQALINIFAVASLIPLTGIPLPFISYGGSSLMALYAAIGLAKNIENINQSLLYSNSDAKQKNNSYRHSPDTGPSLHRSTKKRQND